MDIQEAKKEHLREVKPPPDFKVYDEALHARFLAWKNHSGTSETQIARMIARSVPLVSQYTNKIYTGDIQAVERDIRSLLTRQEDLEFVGRKHPFCNTLNARLIWEALQFCDEYRDMGVVVGPSGSGKTTVCNEYKHENRGSILCTADLTRRSISEVLRMIATKISRRIENRTRNSTLLDEVVDQLKHSNRLIIIDEAHLLRWENFEILRKIHDCAGVGIAYVGQERLYDQMKGASDKAYLFDQIYGRITMKRDNLSVERKDVQLLADVIEPGLDKACIDFLFERAKERKKFRNVTKTLQVAHRTHRDFGEPMGLDLLRKSYEFLLRAEE